MNFIGVWAIFYAAIMAAMSIDNLTWIPTDSRFPKMKKEFFIFIIRGREFVFPKTKKGLMWCLERIKDVNTHVYDIVPGLITSSALTIIKINTNIL